MVATNDLPAAWAGRVVSDTFWIRGPQREKQAYFDTQTLIDDWSQYGGGYGLMATWFPCQHGGL